MNLKRSPFSILNNERREIDYIKGVYKRKIQDEIESYKDPEDEDEKDTIFKEGKAEAIKELSNKLDSIEQKADEVYEKVKKKKKDKKKKKNN